MAYRELELTLLSAQDLKSVNLITRMDVYAVVSISGDPLTRQCTEPDTYGGRNPCWNATFRFAVPATAASSGGRNASLHVLLRAERFLGDRDVGEVVVPLHEILATASGVGPQPPQVASYQVRKLHRYEPRGVLNVAYRLGPVVAPVPEPRAAPPEKPPVVYAPVVGVPPQQPSHQYPLDVPYQTPPAPAAAPGPPAGRVVAQHDEAAAQKKSPAVVMAYPAVGVPQQQQQQQASHPPAKPDAYRPPSPSPPPPRPAARHEEAPARAPAPAASPARAPSPSPPPPRPTPRHEEAPAPAPAPARAPAASPAARAPSPGNTRRSNDDGFGQAQQQAGPTHVYMGPHSQIIFGGGSSASTTAGGPPTKMTSPARPIISPAAGKKSDGNWALLTQGGGGGDGNWALPTQGGGRGGNSAAESMSSVISPRSRMEDRWRPTGLSHSQQQEAARSPVAAPSPQRLAASASPFSSRSSSFSSSPSPLSPYSSGSAHPSPSPSSAHSSTRSPYSSDHPSTTTSPLRRSPAVSGAAAEVTHITNNTFRSTSYRGTVVSSPLPSSSPLVPSHSRGAAAVSSPLPWSTAPTL